MAVWVELELWTSVSSHSSRIAILTKQKHRAVSSVQRTRTWGTTGIVRHPPQGGGQRRTAEVAANVGGSATNENSRMRRSGVWQSCSQGSGAPGTRLQVQPRTFRATCGQGSKGKSTTASIAVICAFAAMGMLATNIFLPSLPAMAADLHVSSAAITSTISVFWLSLPSDN